MIGNVMKYKKTYLKVTANGRDRVNETEEHLSITRQTSVRQKDRFTTGKTTPSTVDQDVVRMLPMYHVKRYTKFVATRISFPTSFFSEGFLASS